MSLRDRFRATRLYLRSYRLFRETFRDSAKALALPISDRVRFHPRSGAAAVEVPGACWTMLPTVCRLLASGAVPSWEDGILKVRFGEYVFYSPALDKSAGSMLKEIFIDDVYGIKELDLAGKTVLDIGAYIGDSTIAFAARGAFVHAFEPVPIIQEFLRRNIAANAMDGRVRVHPVGLSDRDQNIVINANITGLAGTTVLPVNTEPRAATALVPQRLRMANAFEYLASAGITAADAIKLDCEGCEYALLRDGALLETLRPKHVTMEYHRGGAPLRDLLAAHGYRVDWPDPEVAVGYMRATRA